MQGVEGALEVRRPGEQEPLLGGVLGVPEPVLRPLPVHLVGVGVGARATDEGDLDLLEVLVALGQELRVVVGIDKGPEGHAAALPFLGQDVVQMRVHPVVGVVHGPFPLRLLLGRKRAGSAAGLVNATEHAQQVRHHLDDAARVELAQAPHAAVGAHGVVGEDGFQMRGLLHGRPELFAAEGGDADHAHIAVTPGLGGDPFDHVVVVPYVLAVLTLRLAHSSQLRDHVRVAVGHQALGIPSLDHPVPQAGVGRLRRQGLGEFRPLQVLVVYGAGVEHGILALRLGPVDVDRKLDPVAHLHHDVALLDHVLVDGFVHSHDYLLDHRPDGPSSALQTIQHPLGDRCRRPASARGPAVTEAASVPGAPHEAMHAKVSKSIPSTEPRK